MRRSFQLSRLTVILKPACGLAWFAVRHSQRKIRQDDLASARRNQVEALSAYYGFKLRHHVLLGNDVGALRLEPEILELSIVDEDIGHTRSVGPIFQIEEAAVAK